MTMQFIASQTVGAGGASTIDFQNIPSTFTHLQLRLFERGSSSTAIYTAIQFNGVTTGNLYGMHYVYGDGAGVASNAYITRNDMPLDFGVYSTLTANVFSNTIVDILDYANTNKFKTTRALKGYDVNGANGFVSLQSGLFRSTDAISSIKIFPVPGNYVQNCRFDLYGITTSALTGA